MCRHKKGSDNKCGFKKQDVLNAYQRRYCVKWYGNVVKKPLNDHVRSCQEREAEGYRKQCEIDVLVNRHPTVNTIVRQCS